MKNCIDCLYCDCEVKYERQGILLREISEWSCSLHKTIIEDPEVEDCSKWHEEYKGL
jgi:hypothetical protein